MSFASSTQLPFSPNHQPKTYQSPQPILSSIRTASTSLFTRPDDLLGPSLPIFNALEDFYKVAVFDVRDIDAICVPNCFVQMFVGFLSVKVPQRRLVRYEAFAIIQVQDAAEEIVGDVVEKPNAIRGSKFKRQTCARSR